MGYNKGMADRAHFDVNNRSTIIGVDSSLFSDPVTIAVNPTTHAILTEGSSAGGLGIPSYDYVSMALSDGDTTETYTFKSGGSSGTTVATVVVVYTDSSREVLSSVTKT